MTMPILIVGFKRALYKRVVTEISDVMQAFGRRKN